MANGFLKKKKKDCSDWPVLHVYGVASYSLKCFVKHWRFAVCAPSLGFEALWSNVLTSNGGAAPLAVPFGSAYGVNFLNVKWRWLLFAAENIQIHEGVLRQLLFQFFFPEFFFCSAERSGGLTAGVAPPFRDSTSCFARSFKGKWGSALVSLARRRPWPVFNPPRPP